MLNQTEGLFHFLRSTEKGERSFSACLGAWIWISVWLKHSILWEPTPALHQELLHLHTQTFYRTATNTKALSQHFQISSSSSARWQLFAVTWFTQHISSSYLRIKGILPEGSHSDKQKWFLSQPHLWKLEDTHGTF